MVVLHAVSVPHHVGSHWQPQRFAPPPPQVCPFEQVPHWIFVPQPLSISPQFALA
jgi:hypothetical protein